MGEAMRVGKEAWVAAAVSGMVATSSLASAQEAGGAGAADAAVDRYIA